MSCNAVAAPGVSEGGTLHGSVRAVQSQPGHYEPAAPALQPAKAMGAARRWAVLGGSVAAYAPPIRQAAAAAAPASSAAAVRVHRRRLAAAHGAWEGGACGAGLAAARRPQAGARLRGGVSASTMADHDATFGCSHLPFNPLRQQAGCLPAARKPPAPARIAGVCWATP